MERSVALTLLVILGNALTFAVGPLILYPPAVTFSSEIFLPAGGLLGAAAYAALSAISARNFKRKFGLGYRKYFLFGAFPALVISAVLGLLIFHGDSMEWVFSMFAMFFALAYCSLFGGTLLVVWGREEYDRNN